MIAAPDETYTHTGRALPRSAHSRRVSARCHVVIVSLEMKLGVLQVSTQSVNAAHTRGTIKSAQIIDGVSYLHNSDFFFQDSAWQSLSEQHLRHERAAVENRRLLLLHRHQGRRESILRFRRSTGFLFNGSQMLNFPCYPWTKKLPVALQPDLDFLAPEYLAPNQASIR